MKNLADFESFSKDLLALRIAEIQSLRFPHSELNKFASEADLLALDDAHASADKLINRIQGKKGKIIYREPRKTTVFEGSTPSEESIFPYTERKY